MARLFAELRRHYRRSPRSGPAALLRLSRIHEHLLAKRRVTAASLAAEFEMSPRTLKRDIETLRDFHQAPIEWCHAARSYLASPSLGSACRPAHPCGARIETSGRPT